MKGEEKMNDGCSRIFAIAFTVFAIVMMILLSVAGVHSMGFFGIFVGPIVVLIGWIILSGIFS